MSVFILKTIAIISMLIDHSTAVFVPFTDENYWSYIILRGLGRIAFPIFAFLIAQGCLYTKNIGKYALRLVIFALISELFYDLALTGEVNFLADTNIFFALALAVAAIAVYRLLLRPNWEIVAALVVAPFAMVAELISSDYGAFGVIFIFLLYLANPAIKWRMVVIIMLWAIFNYLDHQIFILFCLVPAVLIALHSGKLGFNHILAKYAFYAFYPAHLAILALLKKI
ncbi:MAG: conjugal transfer protein TraX [Defluviitaleaceae bacterium]|nr:conjugal transfer protein TraX [Defluviitaleaceae bacterium]